MAWTLPLGISLLGPDFPLPLDRPFSLEQAKAAGITRYTVGRLHSDGLVRRVLKGVYVPAQQPDDVLVRARALALVVPADAVIVDWTACWLHTGVMPPNAHLETPPLAVFRHAGRGRLRNGLCHSGERALLPRDLTRVAGLRVTTALRTAWDLGRLMPRDWALAGMDALAATGHFTTEALTTDVERFRRQRGVVQLRDLAPKVDPRAESPAESVLRLRWLDMPSLPSPTPQVRILLPDGREIYRIDLGVEELKFGLEYDGHEHHSSELDRRHDELRRRDLEERFGWHVLAVTRDNVFGRHRDVEVVLLQGIEEARRRLARPSRSA